MAIFDLEKLKLNGSSFEPVERILTKVPVKKPDKQTFVRTHQSPEYRMHAWVLTWREGTTADSYVVNPDLVSELSNEVVACSLITTVDKNGEIFFWKIRLPDSSGKIDHWNESATIAAELAQTAWVRVSSNKSLGGYEVFRAKGELGEPQWPDKTFSELFDIAFKDFYIDTMDHIIVKKLRGLA